MLGRDLIPLLKDYILIPTDIHNLDITLTKSIQSIVNLNPSLVIHLAAYTDVDGCELNPKRACKVNSIGTKNVCLACQELRVPILYISTDYIFDGKKPTPYLEWDSPNPINIYGKTKLDGELWVKKLLEKFWIIRTSGLYGKWGKNFVDTVVKKGKETHKIEVVDDQIGAPTYTKDIAHAIQKLIKTKYFGIYHITNSDCCSWYEFAQAIIKISKISCEVLPISSQKLKKPAKRPYNWRLLNFVWDRVFGKPLRPWEEALNEYIKENAKL